jgi:hypothetical protein|tara:strand:+ start:422 stop:643 length:222 start_codon:yes stop_codon:yes gene_type:complete
MDGLLKYAKHGIIGVILALIGLVALLAGGYYKTVGNHIDHNTKALTGVERALEGNTKVIESNTMMMNTLLLKK